MKNLFKINIFTYVFLILSTLSGFIREIAVVFIILVVHELGHFFLMKLNKIEVDSITIYPYGGMIKSNMLINTSSLKVIFISLGGIISQLILWSIVFILYRLGILNIFYYEIFFKYNIYIIIFNLIPIYPLDGFKIVNGLLELFISFKRSVYISFFINIIFLILFFIYLFIYKVNNYLIVLFLLVNLINYIKEIKYIINKFFIERIIYDLSYKGIISVKNISCMFKNRFNYINGIGEKEYLKRKYNI